MPSPLLTIAIPTYNRCAFLDRCLQSIEEALKAIPMDVEIEVLVLDNASQDDTAAIAHKHEATLRGFRYLQNESNIGGNLNIARVADLARGQYVWCLGDDDWLMPEALHRIHEALIAKVDYVILNYAVYERGYVAPTIGKRLHINRDVEFIDANTALRFLGYIPGFISCVVARKSILCSLSTAEVTRYALLGFNQLYAFYVGIATQPRGMVLADVLVGNLCSGLEDTDLADHYFAFGLGTVFSNLKKIRPYRPAAIVAAKRATVRTALVGRIANARLQQRPARNIIAGLFRYYKATPEMWGMCIPLAILPSGVIQLLLSMKKYIATHVTK